MDKQPSSKIPSADANSNKITPSDTHSNMASPSAVPLEEKKPLRFNFKDLPPCIRPFVSSAPSDFKLAVLLSVLCCYCALATRLRVKYPYDIDLHALLVQVLICGEPGAGKSFTRGIVNRLMGQLKLRDKEMRAKEKEYRKAVKKLKNKTLPDEPQIDVRCIQTITKAMLTKRVDEIQSKYGETLALFLFSEEASLLADSNRRIFADLRTLDRLAYDLGAEFCSESMYDAGVNSEVDIIWCSLFCGTENSIKEYIDKRSIEGGNVTRKILCRLPDMLGNKAPAFMPIEEEDASCIEQMVTRLLHETYGDDDTLQPTHVVPMEWLDKQVNKWCDKQRMEVIRTGSRSRNCFYKRSSVSAFRLATMLYYLWGEDKTKQKSVSRFYQFMATYILEGLLGQWGREFDEMHQGDTDELMPSKQSIYDLCPKRFTRDQLRELIVKLNLKTDARHFISRWKIAHLIHQVKENETELFEKNY